MSEKELIRDLNDHMGDYSTALTEKLDKCVCPICGSKVKIAFEPSIQLSNVMTIKASCRYGASIRAHGTITAVCGIQIDGSFDINNPADPYLSGIDACMKMFNDEAKRVMKKEIKRDA